MTTNAPSSLPFAASPPEGTNDIRGLKPPIDIPNVWIWVWIALGAVALVVAIYFIIRFWQKKAAEPVPAPIIPPHERARQRLAEALAIIDQPRPFCIMVSDTARVYLEERFNFHAPERTTEEFLYELKATDLLLPDQKESLGQFLSVCDMVKFAKYEPGMTELHALHNSAARLIDETEPHPLSPDSAPVDPVQS